MCLLRGQHCRAKKTVAYAFEGFTITQRTDMSRRGCAGSASSASSAGKGTRTEATPKEEEWVCLGQVKGEDKDLWVLSEDVFNLSGREWLELIAPLQAYHARKAKVMRRQLKSRVYARRNRRAESHRAEKIQEECNKLKRDNSRLSRLIANVELKIAQEQRRMDVEAAKAVEDAELALAVCRARELSEANAEEKENRDEEQLAPSKSVVVRLPCVDIQLLDDCDAVLGMNAWMGWHECDNSFVD